MRRIFSYSTEIIFLILFLLIGIAIITWLIFFASFYTKDNIFIQYFLTLLDVVFIGMVFYFVRMGDRFFKGADGEIEVRNILDKLPEGYYHLTDFVKGEKGNIDAIVIGETGIWSIEVKNKSEKVIIRDKYLDKELKQAYAESKELEHILVELGYPIPVTPVLVFANKKTRLNFGMRPINGVYVIGKSWLEELLTKHSGGYYLAAGQSYAIKEKLKVYTSKF